MQVIDYEEFIEKETKTILSVSEQITQHKKEAVKELLKEYSKYSLFFNEVVSTQELKEIENYIHILNRYLIDDGVEEKLLNDSYLWLKIYIEKLYKRYSIYTNEILVEKLRRTT